MSTPLAKLERGSCKAEIYETALPGQFIVRYSNLAGDTLAEEQLSGVSSYHQREGEIIGRLESFCSGEPPKSAQLADSGEY